MIDTVSTALARLFEAIAYAARAVAVASYRMSCALEDGEPEARYWVTYMIGYIGVLILTRWIGL